MISHPHYYTTYATWARTFKCPVVIASEDAHWLCQRPYQQADLQSLRDITTTIVPGVTAIKIGGHFDGQVVLHWEKTIFVADGLVTVPVSEGWEAANARGASCIALDHLDQYCTLTSASLYAQLTPVLFF